MPAHNPTNQSRLCPGLGRNLEPYEVAETPDGFVKCEGCQCVVSDGKPAAKSKGK